MTARKIRVPKFLKICKYCQEKARRMRHHENWVKCRNGHVHRIGEEDDFLPETETTVVAVIYRKRTLDEAVHALADADEAAYRRRVDRRTAMER
jgi:hypothetical protein